jgi:hypothetical protein
MELQSLVRYREFIDNLESTKGVYLDERDKHERHLFIFKNELEAATLMEDDLRIEKANAGIKLIQSKIDAVNEQIGELNIEPLAMACIDECNDKLSELNEKAAYLWQSMLESRIEYLKKLEMLGNVKRESEILAHSCNGPCGVLNRQLLTMKSVKYSGQHQLVVDLPLLNKLLKT